MKMIIGIILICLTGGAASASAQRDYCFKNVGLKLSQTISFTLTKNKIEGTLESGGDMPDTSAETFDFTGTKIGNGLKIIFEDEPPYERPPGVKRRVAWTLSARSLKVPMYGKNYNTRKYGVYTAIFDRCKDDN